MKQLLIFDTSNYIFRAFYAAPPMNNSAGFPTNALHFYTSMVLAVIRKVQPDIVAMACEKRGKKFRHELYPDYKGQREVPPEDLQVQFPYFPKINEALGLKCYDADGFEADDVIATLTQQGLAQGYHVVIASSDKDLMQLVTQDGSVIMLDALAKKAVHGNYLTIGYDEVLARFNVKPSLVADVLALAGDTADNIPGCRGIGEKTAGKLIAEYGTLEALMANVGTIKKPAQKANLEAFMPSAALSKRLTSLVYDVPVELVHSGLSPVAERVIPLFSSLELHKLLLDVLGPDARPDPTVPRVSLKSEENVDNTADDITNPEAESMPNERQSGMPQAANCAPIGSVCRMRDFISTTLIENDADWAAFEAEFKAAGRVALMPIWLSSSVEDRRLVGFAAATESRCAYVANRYERTLFGYASVKLNADSIWQRLLMDVSIHKIVYGVKPCVQYAMAKGASLDMQHFDDVEIAAYLLHPERSTLSLAGCAMEYLGESLEKTPENYLGSGKKQTTPDKLPAIDLGQMAGLWAQCVWQIWEKLPFELESCHLLTPYRTIDLPLAPVLAAMEFYGVGLDIDALHALACEFDNRIQQLDAEIHAYSPDPFNINSTKELAHFLFETLELVPGTKKNRQHGLSTDQDTLESIDHPVAKLILEYRAVSKLRSTYSESLIQLANPETHRIHGKFNACVTATTRLSSSDPNLQNIPSREEIGRQIKRTFVPETGWSFVGADYSQIELRLMAALSKDPVLCQAYRNGEDVHARTAASLFDIPIEQVAADQRRLAKTINFGLLYGMGVQKLARETGYSKADAKAFLEKFHAQFPVLSSFFDAQVEHARENGETRTIMGHRRPMPELYSQRPMERAAGERIALNAPIQGSASDVVKVAMINLVNALRDRGLHGRLLIQVHDELLVECPDNEVEATAKLLVDVMENAADIGVPLKVELKTGKTWADMKSV